MVSAARQWRVIHGARRWSRPARGNLRKGAVWMVEDITGQRQTLDALRESESRLQRIMNSSLIGILYGSDGPV
jgi:PAS domain-containing protein